MKNALRILLSTTALGAALPSLASAAFPGENGKIAYRCVTDICVTEPDGSVATRLTDSRYQQTPSFSANGRWIAMARRVRADHLEVFVMRSDGTRLRRITRSAGSGDPSFTPDGTQIVYTGPSGGIFIIGVDGSGRQRIGTGFAPAVSPDGNSVAFLRSGTGTPFNYPGLWVMDIDGENVTPVATADNDLAAREPAWAPSGERILFEEPGSSAIVTIEPDGSDLIQVSPNDLPPETRLVGEPTFAPDGERVAYLIADCDPSGDCQPRLYTQGLDGTVLTRLTRVDYGAAPDWGVRPPGELPTARCNDKQATIVGTNRDDSITGTSSRDVINARGGSDLIKGLAGNDVLCGGRGNDRVDGGGGNDRCLADAGTDRLRSCEHRP